MSLKSFTISEKGITVQTSLGCSEGPASQVSYVLGHCLVAFSKCHFCHYFLLLFLLLFSSARVFVLLGQVLPQEAKMIPPCLWDKISISHQPWSVRAAMTDTTHWLAYKQPKLIFHSSGAWKSETRVADMVGFW